MKHLRLALSLALVVLIFISSSFTIAAAESNTAYRMTPLLEKLGSINDALIEEELDRFNDMKGHWARKHLGKLTYMEVISGYTDKTFRPDNNIQVDEFIKLTITAMGYKLEMGDTYWAQSFIDKAIELNLIDAGEFKDYKKAITRQEMAKIIVNATLKKELAPEDGHLAFLRSKIKDYNKIPDSYKHPVLTAYGLGLISGYSNEEFRPLNNSTRAEASVVIMRFIDPTARSPIHVETITLVRNIDKQTITLYPPTINPEVITIANVLKNNLHLSKGYATDIYFNGFSNEGVFASFFKNKEEYDYKVPGYTQMAISIKTADDEGIQKNPYDIIIYNVEEVQLKHSEVVKEMFKALFEKDFSKAIAEYEKQLNLTLTSNDGFTNIFIFNDRHILFFKDGSGKQIGIYITRKGFRFSN